jgi:hypothetical protein
LLELWMRLLNEDRDAADTGCACVGRRWGATMSVRVAVGRAPFQ